MVDLQYTVPLPPNRTYPVRSASLFRVTDRDTPFGGVLVVDEQRSPKSRRRTRRYAVRELEPVHGRRFQVRKPATTASESYFVCLAPRPELPGSHDACTCEGYEAAGTCVHAQCLRAFVANGHLPLRGFLGNPAGRDM